MTARSANPIPSGDAVFPLLYHTHHRAYVEDLPFWLRLAREHEDPILELGCGTGRVLVPLAAAGHIVFGLDLDPHMLATLQDRLTPVPGMRAHLLQADMTRFHFARRFGLILLPCNTFSTLTRPQRQSLLSCVGSHLRPGGIFATSIPNPALLARLDRPVEPEVEASFTHPQTGNPVQVSCGWKPETGYLRIDWHYDHLLPDGRVERLTTSSRHDLAPRAEYLDQIRAAGLEIAAVYGDFNHSSHTSQSRNLVIVAKSNEMPTKFLR